MKAQACPRGLGDFKPAFKGENQGVSAPMMYSEDESFNNINPVGKVFYPTYKQIFALYNSNNCVHMTVNKNR